MDAESAFKSRVRDISLIKEKKEGMNVCQDFLLMKPGRAKTKALVQGAFKKTIQPLMWEELLRALPNGEASQDFYNPAARPTSLTEKTFADAINSGQRDRWLGSSKDIVVRGWDFIVNCVDLLPLTASLSQGTPCASNEWPSPAHCNRTPRAAGGVSLWR